MTFREQSRATYKHKVPADAQEHERNPEVCDVNAGQSRCNTCKIQKHPDEHDG
jgi:hypothetical protein